MLATFFADPHWYDSTLTLPDRAVLDAIYAAHDEHIVDYAEYWCLRHPGTTWVEITEWPDETPIVCPQGILAYRVCARVLPAYSTGVWVHVLLDYAGTVLGARFD